MNTMTPNRAKRNSKAPERFSSDEVKAELITGSSNQSHGDKSNSAAKIKLKPLIREPLKVKLPKLKRSQMMQSLSPAKETTGSSAGGSYAKIKLPQKRMGQRNWNNNQASSGTLDSYFHKLSEAVRCSQDDEGGLKTQEPSDLNLSSSSPKDSDDDEYVSKSESFTKEHETGRFEITTAPGSSPANDRHVDETSVEKEAGPMGVGSGIRCPCGVDDDLGVMVECERCSNWQHGHCINVGREEDAYEGYVCAYCLLPPGKHNDSLQLLALNDRFQSKFEALETFMKHRTGNQDGSNEGMSTNENKVDFTYDELEAATHDLRRVSNSLEVKWKLLTSDDYNSELKIWNNPIWSDDPNENRKQQLQTVRFVGDIYKSNLKLNICNMLNQMHKRCQLIRYQISRIDTSGHESQSKLDQLLVTLDGIANLVEQVTDSLKTTG